MPILFTLGRVLFVLVFILSGASKLADISGTAALIAAKFTVPLAFADVAAQAQAATGMPYRASTWNAPQRYAKDRPMAG